MKDIDFTSSGEKITIGPEAKEAVMKKLESDVLVNDAEYVGIMCMHSCMPKFLFFIVHTVVSRVSAYGRFTILPNFQYTGHLPYVNMKWWGQLCGCGNNLVCESLQQ